MALKDIWKDVVDGDFIDPKQINDIAHSAIDNENRTEELENEINGENGWNEQAKAAAVIAENAAKEAASAKNQAVENASIAKDKAQLATDKASEAAESADNASASEKTATDKAKEASESANVAIEAKEAAEKARDDAENAADRAENATEFLKNGALFANALRGKLSGASVRADDVSPIEHELDIKITGENVKGTKVKRCGKNLFDISKVVTYRAGGSGSNPGVSGYGIINNGDGTLTVYTHDTVTSAYLPNNGTLRDFAPDLKVGETYTLNATSIKANGEASNAQRIYLSQAKTTWYFKKSLTITEEMLSSRVHWYVDNAIGADQVATISGIQIELGDTATEYEPYREPVEAVADEDGNVSGLMSLAPSMTLTTDNAGAVIECAYNRDTDKVITDLETKLNTLIATIGG